MVIEEIEIRFIGIDSWNRPIFKDEKKNNYYGDTFNLFDYGTTEEDIKIFYSNRAENRNVDIGLNKCLTYFGKKFDCEPLGLSLTEVKVQVRLII